MPTRKRVLRELLWYFAFLGCLPAFGWGIATGNIAAAAVALPVFLLSVYFSLHKLRCQKCGKLLRVVGHAVSNCPHCGNPYGTQS